MLQNEHVISLTQATKILPNRPHVSSLWRWCRKGIGDIRLEYIRCGRRIYTSVEAVERFCHALAAADDQRADPGARPISSATKSRTAQQMKADIAAAKATLAAAGI